MVIKNSQAPRDVGGCNGRTVAESENPIDILAPHRFKNCVSRRIRRFEMDRNRAIAPGIVQLVAPIRNKNEVNSELPSRFVEAARLITKFGGEEEESRHFYLEGRAGLVPTHNCRWPFSVLLFSSRPGRSKQTVRAWARRSSTTARSKKGPRLGALGVGGDEELADRQQHMPLSRYGRRQRSGTLFCGHPRPRWFAPFRRAHPRAGRHASRGRRAIPDQKSRRSAALPPIPASANLRE